MKSDSPAPDGDLDGFCKLEALMLTHGCTFCTVKCIKAEFAKGARDPRDFKQHSSDKV